VPFVRVLKDKRGYEMTYLMHWFREALPPRSSILYAFRSPGGARVCLHALEPDRQREIEATYPDIDFEWGVLVKTQQVVEVGLEPKWRARRRAKVAAKPVAARVARTPIPPVPSALEGDSHEAQVAFLAEWYPRVRERIQNRASDPTRQTELFAIAERLNAAAWTDADAVVAGLPLAGEALAQLSKVFARRRRSRRGARKPADRSQPQTPTPEATAAPDSIDPADPV